MSPLRSRRRRPRSSSFLLIALGALTGLAVGAVIADRVGGLDGLLKKTVAGRKKRPSDGFDHDEMADATAADHAAVDHDYEDDARAIQGSDFEYANDDDADDSDDGDEDYGDESAASAMDIVEGEDREVPDETELEERVLEAFHNDPVLAERAIDIGAIGTGVIELTGWVQASWEIGHAVTLARGVPDVTTVVDRLAVRDGEKRRDHSGRHYSGDGPLTSPTAELPRAD
ncbi:MAG: BON domain-containing protein [Gemmatimonadaceae bacterium]